MEIGAVGAEKELVYPGALDGLDKVVEPADTRGVGVDVGEADELVDHSLVGAPVVREAAEVGDDEVYPGVLWGEQVDHVGLADDVDEQRESKVLSRLADLARGHPLRPMDFH